MDILPVSLYEYLALFLLCLVSFLIGWFAGRRRKTTTTLLKDEPPKTGVDIGITAPKTVRAIQTRKRGGEAVADGKVRQLHSYNDPEVEEAPEQNEVTYDNLSEKAATAPGEKDDLKQINGIGPTIEKKLNEIGIYSLSQIRDFTRKDIEKVAKHLESYPKKIEKEKWVQQAKALLSTSSHKAD